jgi:hypothetical protein
MGFSREIRGSAWRWARRRGAALAGAAGAAWLAGCSVAPDLSRAGPAPPAATRAQTSVVDIQVFRDETVIRMTNTTARSLPAGRLWINAWYSREFGGLGVGESVSLDLSEFRDRFGEAFRAGGFFAADRPDTVVLAQLEAGEEMIGLIVVGERTY